MSAITISKKDARRFQLCAELGLAPPKPKRKREPRVLPNNPNRCVEHPATFEFVVQVKTENKSNLSLGFSKRAAFAEMGRRKRIRAKTTTATLEAGVPNLLAYQTAAITMERGSAGTGMDSDGLAQALKQVRDAIADCLGFRDDSDRRLTWRCANAKARQKEYWVRVAIEIHCRPESGLLEGKE